MIKYSQHNGRTKKDRPDQGDKQILQEQGKFSPDVLYVVNYTEEYKSLLRGIKNSGNKATTIAKRAELCTANQCSQDEQ